MDFKPAGMFCPLCHGEGSYAFTKEGVDLRECCGCLLSWAWDTVEDYEEQYRGTDYHETACLRQGLPAQWDRFSEHLKAGRARMEWLDEVLGPASLRGRTLVDVGASNGALVQAALHRNYIATGIEPSAFMVEWVWEHTGIALYHGTWEDLLQRWNVVVGTDVIEHLVNPEGFLKRCAEKADWVYLETPDWRPGLGPDFRHVKVFEHPVLYSEEALVELAHRAGLEAEVGYRPIPTKLGMLLRPK